MSVSFIDTYEMTTRKSVTYMRSKRINSVLEDPLVGPAVQWRHRSEEGVFMRLDTTFFAGVFFLLSKGADLDPTAPNEQSLYWNNSSSSSETCF